MLCVHLSAQLRGTGQWWGARGRVGGVNVCGNTDNRAQGTVVRCFLEGFRQDIACQSEPGTLPSTEYARA